MRQFHTKVVVQTMIWFLTNTSTRPTSDALSHLSKAQIGSAPFTLSTLFSNKNPFLRRWWLRQIGGMSHSAIIHQISPNTWPLPCQENLLTWAHFGTHRPISREADITASSTRWRSCLPNYREQIFTTISRLALLQQWRDRPHVFTESCDETKLTWVLQVLHSDFQL